MKKRIFAVLLIAAALLTLASCSRPVEYTVEYGDETYTVNTEAMTVSDGEYIYEYEISANNITITYPDGSTYWESSRGSNGVTMSSAGWSDDYDVLGETYASGFALTDILEDERPSAGKRSGIGFIGALLLITVGLLNIIAPQSSWRWSYGWMYKNAEPSDAALIAYRVSGVVVIIIAIVLIFI